MLFNIYVLLYATYANITLNMNLFRPIGKQYFPRTYQPKKNLSRSIYELQKVSDSSHHRKPRFFG